MEPKEPREDEPSRIPWHAAFVEALQVELQDYKDALQFYPEYQLTTEPLRIDCVVVKKARGVEIKKNIAAIFRGWNLLEYKSPDDYVSVPDFHKVYGYACFYISLEKVPVKDLTISFVESRYPKKLIKYLVEECEYTVEEREPGIYIVKGDILPIQLIDSRHLSEEENLWLRSLDNRLDPAALGRVSAEAAGLGKGARISAYIWTIAEANSGAVDEAIRMGDEMSRLEKVLRDAGWLDRWKAEGLAEGRATGRAEGRAEGRAAGKVEGRAEGKAEGQRELLALLESGKTIKEAKQILGLTANLTP